MFIFQIDVLLITPVNGAKLIENPKNYEGYDTSTLTTFMTGGSTTYPKQFLAYIKIFPNAELIHGYGMTETGGLVVKPYSLDLKDVRSLKKPCVGTPIPGFRYKVIFQYLLFFSFLYSIITANMPVLPSSRQFCNLYNKQC